VFNPIELRFALPPESPLTPMLIERIDAQLAQLKRDPNSIYYRKLEEYLLETPKQKTVIRWPPWLLPALLSAGGVIIVLFLAILIVRREVRERAAVEKARRRSEERFELAMRGANDGLWDWNLVTNELYYSPRWASMLGYSVEELTPSIETFRELIHPEDRDRVLAVEADYISGQIDRYETEFRLRHRDGVYIDVLSRGFLVRDEDDKPLRVVGTHVDISERKYAAQQLKEAKERAEAADRIKSAFLATMSHELRTPLNSIIGFTGILLQKLAGPLTDEQAKQLGMVKTSARHLLDLINDVLDISKIEAGQLEVFFEPFDAAELIREMVNAARPLAAAKGLEVRLDIDESVGEIRSDRRRVGQILTNLLSNAVKFTEEGHVRVACTQEDGSIVITVEDTGIGISPDDLAKLFVPFQQIDSGLTRKYEGTGLGLSICKRLCDKLRGKVSVESELGRGSLFRVTIPDVR
jgi:PAS domain S-box-containing protein